MTRRPPHLRLGLGETLRHALGIIAATFHPELTRGLAFHRYVADLARKTQGARPAPDHSGKATPQPNP